MDCRRIIDGSSTDLKKEEKKKKECDAVWAVAALRYDHCVSFFFFGERGAGGGHLSGEMFCVCECFRHRTGSHISVNSSGCRELWENAGECAGKAERQRTTDSRGAKEDMGRKEEARVQLLTFQGRRWTCVIRPGSVTGRHHVLLAKSVLMKDNTNSWRGGGGGGSLFFFFSVEHIQCVVVARDCPREGKGGRKGL